VLPESDSASEPPLRIAQISPLYESVPPKLYGGTERVVSWLTEELVAMGHDVTLFASGDSHTAGHLIPAAPVALWRDTATRETLPQHVRMLEMVFKQRSQFDVLHFHCDYIHFPLLRRTPCASVTTLHGQIHLHDVNELFAEFRDVPLVSISNAQRGPLPDANWLATVHHGLPKQLHAFQMMPGRYLVFVGRIAPEKRLDRAIEIAKLSGRQLKIAAKIYEEDQSYYRSEIAPILERSRDFVEFVGEVGGRDKDALIGGAAAFLFPIDWAEPFGLVMIEALACGTPVVAWRNGSVPEVIEHGRTGFVVESIGEAVESVRRIGQISRQACRHAFEQRFTARRMALDYVQVYRRAMRL
jgi:glycosyltransferase involved in cell wall biosynthesis